jgi:general stress protein 26
MKSWKLTDISKKMKNLDICMLSTHAGRGQLNSRPMSNNGDVEYDGNSYFFSYDGSSLVNEIAADAHVNLSFEGTKHLFITMAGKASLIRSRAKMEEHWIGELTQWFKEGLDTPGIVMIQVESSLIRYWEGEEQGEIKV